MLVADHNQLASSATLGAESASAMKFSSDPALFMAMIANLYSNQKLAFVRETLCNHWDAHIDKGITDTPISITLTDDNLLIMRDYGYGIPIDMMEDTYNTLGGTTKRSKIKETGGFGLGCKSPLAYVESFKVTTINNGTKAVYNMVRSAVELEGRPGLVPIIQVPTTEPSGIELQIQLEDYDVIEILQYIYSICYSGEIRAILNYNEEVKHLKNLGMSFEPGSYDIEGEWYNKHMGHGSIFIRYANVVYPVLDTPATAPAIRLVRQFIDIIGCSRILIQAAPGTLALAPSREAFTSQKMTEDGIADMCVALVAKLEKDIKEQIPDEISKLKVTLSKPTQWRYFGKIDWINQVRNPVVRRYINSSLYAAQRKHISKELHNKVIEGYLNNPDINKEWEYYPQLKAAITRAYKESSYRHYIDFVRRYVTNPIYRNLSKLGIKSKQVMWYYDAYEPVTSDISRTFITGSTILNMVNCRRVFLVTRSNHLTESIDNYPPFRNGEVHIDKRQALIVRVGTRRIDASSMAIKFKAAGWEVIDMTKKPNWDLYVQKRVVAKEVKAKPENRGKDKPNRLISIGCLLGNKRRRFYRSSANATYGENHIDIDKPLYYVEQCEVGSYYLGDYLSCNEITPELINTTVVCRNKIEVNKAINRGAVHINTLMCRDRIADIFSKGFYKYITTERKLWLKYIGTRSKTLKIFKLLNIRLPQYEKLYYNPKYENLISFLCEDKRLLALKSSNIITEQEYDFILNLSHSRIFKHYDFFSNLNNLWYTGIMHSNERTMFKHLTNHPEDIPAIRTLTKNLLKRG